MKHFNTIVIGTGPTTERLAGAISAEDPSCGIAMPEGQIDVPIESLTALMADQIEWIEPLAPSSLARVSGKVLFENSRTIRIGAESWEANNIVVATGARPLLPALQGLSVAEALFPQDFLTGKYEAGEFIILGDGPMACALAFYLHGKKCDVTLVARASRLLSEEEPEISAAVAEKLVRLGVHLEQHAEPIQVRRDNARTHLVFERDSTRQEVNGDHLVVAEGLSPNTIGLGLKEIGVYLDESGAIVTDEEMRSSAKGVWAAGTVTGATALNQIENQIRLITVNVGAPFYARTRRDPDPLPYHLPLLPPLARIGWKESEAKKRWGDVRVAVLPLQNGFAKILARKRNGRLLGASLFCEGAAELSLFFNLAFQMGMSVFDLNEPQHYLSLTEASTALRLINVWLQS